MAWWKDGHEWSIGSNKLRNIWFQWTKIHRKKCLNIRRLEYIT